MDVVAVISQLWWQTFSRFCINELGFISHPMDACVLILFEDLKKHDSDFDMDKIRVIGGSGAEVLRVAEPGDMCGVLGQHVDDSILGGRGKKGPMQSLCFANVFRFASG